MSIVRKIRRTLRGDVGPTAAARELLRRSRTRFDRRRERSRLGKLQEREARLHPKFAALTSSELLDHFRKRSQPAFLPGFSANAAALQNILFPEETEQLLKQAGRIVDDHSWPLLGLGNTNFGEQIDWHRDPVSDFHWQLEYHADLNLFRDDGSDVRVLWELNRLPHFLTLARAYAVSKNERFTKEFLSQIQSWFSQNPYGMGANWNCAMEVALRATNLLGAFETFRQSPLLDERNLATLLTIFDQHGSFIRRNLEFSHIATSNHYLSDVIGLLWLGIMLPELESASDWREFGLREMLSEMDKQVLADGADFESSTGYHRFVLELFLYTFILCRANNLKIDDKYWNKLRLMVDYLRAYLRPDGRAPLIGDSDSGQFFPVIKRAGDDHAYLLPIGTVAFGDAKLSVPNQPIPEELLWTLGDTGVHEYEKLQREATPPASQSFPDAGIYVLRDRDLYLLFNASDAGIHGRGSHGHNDALSVEVSACGSPFIVDAGSYAYTADLDQRHLFRSTSYHSTIQIDSVEQNHTHKETPFVIGNEAQPRVTKWDSTLERDDVTATHFGYKSLNGQPIHRRSITFDKKKRYWLIEDEIGCSTQHDLAIRFHFAEGVAVHTTSDAVLVQNTVSGARLVLKAMDLKTAPQLEKQFISRDYLSKSERMVATYTTQTNTMTELRWLLVPVCADEDIAQRLNAIIQ